MENILPKIYYPKSILFHYFIGKIQAPSFFKEAAILVAKHEFSWQTNELQIKAKKASSVDLNIQRLSLALSCHPGEGHNTLYIHCDLIGRGEGEIVPFRGWKTLLSIPGSFSPPVDIFPTFPTTPLHLAPQSG